MIGSRITVTDAHEKASQSHQAMSGQISTHSAWVVRGHKRGNPWWYRLGISNKSSASPDPFSRTTSCVVTESFARKKNRKHRLCSQITAVRRCLLQSSNAATSSTRPPLYPSPKISLNLIDDLNLRICSPCGYSRLCAVGCLSWRAAGAMQRPFL